MTMNTIDKPRTETEALFGDLDKPSLHALSYALRHPDTWPDGFYWDYNRCQKCAMGLAHRLWESYVPWVGIDSGPSVMAKTFSMPYAASKRIFMDADKHHKDSYLFGMIKIARMSSITPEMVADDIDAFLARAE